VAFGGLGEVVTGGKQPFRTKNFLPSGGGGARFELSKKYRVNLRADFAQGKDSHTGSIGVGEVSRVPFKTCRPVNSDSGNDSF
jgi:hypothetical protein